MTDAEHGGHGLPAPVAAQVDLMAEGWGPGAWHGPGLASAIRGVGWEEASWKPGAGGHSIGEIVLHCAYWKRAVLRRIGGRWIEPARPGRDWPEPVDPPTAADWEADRRELRESHADLLDGVRALTARELDEPGAGQTRTRRTHLRGIAVHDAYHAGQIRLLRRQWSERGGRAADGASARVPAAGVGGRASRAETGPAPGVGAEGVGEGGAPAVLRTWRGAVDPADRDDYVRYVVASGIAAYRAAPGFRGAWIATERRADETAVLVTSLWESMDAVADFAGPDPSAAVFFPEDDRWLTDRDLRVGNWTVRWSGGAG